MCKTKKIKIKFAPSWRGVTEKLGQQLTKAVCNVVQALQQHIRGVRFDALQATSLQLRSENGVCRVVDNGRAYARPRLAVRARRIELRRLLYPAPRVLQHCGEEAVGSLRPACRLTLVCRSGDICAATSELGHETLQSRSVRERAPL